MPDEQIPKDDHHNPMSSVNHGRKSSEGQLFNSMQQAKRHSGNDKAEANRRSLADQSASKGAFGNMWDSMMKGQQKK